ncbi:23S rRNA (adenine(2503)-C(2))-methyltransferase RlmN [Nannocystaceae bacterium ST9]
MLVLAQHDRASLERWMVERREPRSHAGRVLRAFYAAQGRPDWDALELGAPLRERLRSELAEPATRVLRRVESGDGTIKLLLGLRRGGTIETVMMQSYREGEAWCCVSSQVGCAMGCDFCASTRAGLERNLEVDEIVEQYLQVGALAAERGRKVRRLVFMGMGEPMHNLDAVLAAIERIAAPGLGNLGWRRITVSTVGVVHGIERLAAAEHPVFLALSLHAPDDETRAKIVPTGKRYTVADILAAARDYQARTDRIVTIEYCLLAGVNDADAQAELLAERLADFRAHVNLIPYNPTGPGLSGAIYVRPSSARVERFLAILRERGVVAHARDARGDDVAAACGQLRDSTNDG